MALECPHNKAHLHRLGSTSIQKSPWSFRVYKKAPSPAQEPQIPSPDLFRFSDFLIDEEAPDSQSNLSHFPEPSECAVHLELLQTFYVLRQTVLASTAIDEHYPITPNREVKVGEQGDTKTFKDPALWSRRQVKWPTYVEFAVVRFLAWRAWINGTPSAVDKIPGTGRVKLRWLPPLDVLMVWHSLMLNPKTLWDACKHEPLYKLRIPWKAVHDTINNREWTYTLPQAASDAFFAYVGLEADLVDVMSTWASASHAFTDNGLSSYVLDCEKADGQVNLLRAISTGADTADQYQKLFLNVATVFAQTLRDAVLRQADFVDKMSQRMWIRSPALKGTLRRAVHRYTQFLQVMRRHPGRMVVPTLDIDLVWHTHQCLSAGYRAAVVAAVGRFVNHDDTLAQDTLGDGFAWSRGVWRADFGREYRICGCWDCEMLLSELERLAAGDDATAEDMKAVSKKAADTVQYYRAVEMAVRKREALPLFA